MPDTDRAAVHTPGPWELSGTTIRGTRNDLGRLGVVADTAVHHSNQTDMKPEHEANARLVADAPSILAALRELHDFAEPSQHFRDMQRSRKAFETASKLLKKHGG